MTIGERFKYYRKMYGLPLDKLAELLKNEGILKCSKSTVSRIERDMLEASLNYTLAFIKTLSKLKPVEDFGDRKISIFSFLSQDINDLDKLESANVEVLSKAISKIKPDPTITYDIPLFNTIFDVSKPFYQYLLSYEGTEKFLIEFNSHIISYKSIYHKKLEYDYKIKQSNGKYDKQVYDEEITQPMQNQVSLIRACFNSFLKGFLDFYCHK